MKALRIQICLIVILLNSAHPSFAENISQSTSPLATYKEAQTLFNSGNTQKARSIYEALLSNPNLTREDKVAIHFSLLSIYKDTLNYSKLLSGLTAVADIIFDGTYFTKDNYLQQSAVWFSFKYYNSFLFEREAAIEYLEKAISKANVNEYNLSALILIRSQIALFQLEESNKEEADRRMAEAVILAGSAKGLDKKIIGKLLMDLANYLNDTGRTSLAYQIIKAIDTGSRGGIKNIKLFLWDLMKARTQLEMGLMEDCYKTILGAEEYINPNLQAPIFHLLRKNYFKGVCGSFAGKRGELDSTLDEFDRLDPANLYYKWTTRARAVIYYLKGGMSSFQKIAGKDFINPELLEDSPTEKESIKDDNHTLKIIYSISLSRIKANDGELKTSSNLLLNGIRKHIDYLNGEIHLSTHTKFNFDWSDRYILMEMLELLFKQNSSNHDAALIFKTLQYINHKHDNTGAILKRVMEGADTDIEKAEFGSFERLTYHFNNLLRGSVSKIINEARNTNIKSGKITWDNGFLYLYGRFHQIIKKLKGKKDILDKLISAGKIFPDLPLVQAQLEQDEVIVMPTFLKDKLFITCIEKFDSHYVTTQYSKPKVIELIKSVRESLSSTSALSSRSNFFPFADSIALYNMIFKPISSCLDNKSHINIIPDSILLNLPYNALITKSTNIKSKPNSFLEAPWLIRNYSVSLVPSVKSFYMLRQLANKPSGKNDFLGFGKSQFGKNNNESLDIAENEYFLRGINLTKSLNLLAALPETRNEINGIAEIFSPSKTKVYLDKEASELNLRKENLNDYKIISFATHALMGGESDLTWEPALIFTSGDTSNSLDDGIVTASEISALSLNANLVILSACNTFSSDGSIDGSRLSGLANSFFLAGARSLAITQWPVYSKMAEVITTRMVSEGINNSRGVAESLRRTMLYLLEHPIKGYNSHPKYWAPFIIAGNGKQLIGANVLHQAKKVLNFPWMHYSDISSRGEFVIHDNTRNLFYLSGWSSLNVNNQIRKVPFIKILTKSGDTLKSKSFQDLHGGVTSIRKVFKNKIAILGIPRTKIDPSVQLFILDKDLEIIWKYRIKANAGLLHMGVVGDDDFVYLILGSIDFRKNIPEQARVPYSISIYKINGKGELVFSNSFFPKDESGSKISSIRADRRYSLFVATIDDGNVVFIVDYQDKALKTKNTNPKYKCRDMVSTLILLNAETLLPSKELYFRNYFFQSIKKGPDDSFYLIGNHEKECGSPSNLSIIRGDLEKGFNPFFTFESPLSQFANDIIFYKNKIVATGSTTFIFYPTLDHTTALQAIKKSGYDSKWLEESILVTGLKQLGWILLVDSNGKLLKDKIIFDNRFSTIIGLDVNDKGEGIATGVINGYQLLEMGFSLN